MEFKCFTEWNQLPKSSDALFLQAEKNSLFFSDLWFKNLVTTALHNDQRLLLACVLGKTETGAIENSKVLATLPLIRCDKGHNAEWGSLNHFFTSLYTVLLANNNQQKIAHCLAEGLSQLPVDSLTFDPIEENDRNIDILISALESFGFDSNRHTQLYNWFHPLQGQTFSEYMAARPSRVRNTIARKQRKLKREHNYTINLYTGDDIRQGLADYHAVYAASWKPKEVYKDVIEGFTNSFIEAGWLRLAVLYSENRQPIATQLWFVVHKKASIFRLAYDEAWKPYSPGSILTEYLMKYVIDTDNVEEIDFLTGNDSYKQDWMSQRRQRWKIVCTRRQESVKNRNPLHKLLIKWVR